MGGRPCKRSAAPSNAETGNGRWLAWGADDIRPVRFNYVLPVGASALLRTHAVRAARVHSNSTRTESYVAIPPDPEVPVPDRMLDVSVSEVVLDRPRVQSVVSKFEAARDGACAGARGNPPVPSHLLGRRSFAQKNQSTALGVLWQIRRVTLNTLVGVAARLAILDHRADA